MIDTEEKTFSNLDDDELRSFQQLVRSANSILWVSAGSLSQGSRPEVNMVNGITKALKIEMPSLQFSTLDFDDLTQLATKDGFDHILSTALKNVDCGPDTIDRETRVRDGIACSSRVIMDDELNAKYGAAQGHEQSSFMASLDALHNERLELEIAAPGMPQSAQFKITEESLSEGNSSNSICIDVQATGLSPNVSCPASLDDL